MDGGRFGEQAKLSYPAGSIRVMSGDEVEALVASLGAALDGLLEADFESLDEARFPDVLEAFETERRRLDAVDVRLLAAVEQQHIAARHCRSSTADLLTHRLRVAPGQARARVRRARDLGPRRTLQGEPLAAIHPILAAAQVAGEISTRHIDVATRALGRLPAEIAVEASGPAEQYLVDAARHQAPDALASSATMLLSRLDPDGAEPDDERAYAHRDLHLYRRADGSWTLRASLTDETGLALRAVLDPLAAPAPSTDVERDTRRADQRDHDALLALCTRVLSAGVLPDAGGAPVTIVLRMRPEDLRSPGGVCQTSHGDVMRVGALQQLLGDAELVPLLFDRAAGDCRLTLGRTRRCANRAQRRALTGRDGGCSFPGCTRPASWCEVHHVKEWTADHGPTDIDNLTLLCGFHHREFGRRGWRVEMSEGLPHWIPPRWLDPDQKPVRNVAHHLPDIVFDPGGTIAAFRQ